MIIEFAPDPIRPSHSLAWVAGIPENGSGRNPSEAVAQLKKALKRRIMALGIDRVMSEQSLPYTIGISPGFTLIDLDSELKSDEQ